MEEGQVNTPVEQNAPEATAEQASPETTVEQAPVAPMAPAEEKKSNGLIIGLVLLALVAAGGVGFGVWQMMQGSSKDKQIADLKTQVTNCANANNGSTEAETETVTCPDGTEVIVEKPTDLDPEEYIYLVEYGIKIKKPENWRSLIYDYSFVNGAPQGMDSYEIRESSKQGDGVLILKQSHCTDSLNPERAVCIELGDNTYVIGILSGELAPGSENTITDSFWDYFIDEENYLEI